MTPLRWQLLASHVPAGGALGGMVRYVVEVAAALDRRPDVDLSVLASSAAVPFFRDLLSEDSTVQSVPDRPTVATSLVERYTRRVERDGPFDVVHGTKHLLPRRSRAARILTVHDMVSFDRPQDFGRAKRTLLGPPYLGSIRDADAVLCVSQATRAAMLRRVPEAQPKSRVVPLAVSSTLLSATPTPVPGLVGKRFAVVVGDSSLRKNLPLVVDSWEAVSAGAGDVVLALIGPQSWGASDYGRTLDRLRADGRVLALGHVSDAELRWCYENAAVALCPSLLEGFGLPALEALVFGAPLVTSTDPALCEASAGRATHVPADRADLWIEAMIDALTRPRDRATDFASPRTWDDVVDETVRAAREIGDIT